MEGIDLDFLYFATLIFLGGLFYFSFKRLAAAWTYSARSMEKIAESIDSASLQIQEAARLTRAEMRKTEKKLKGDIEAAKNEIISTIKEVNNEK